MAEDFTTGLEGLIQPADDGGTPAYSPPAPQQIDTNPFDQLDAEFKTAYGKNLYFTGKDTAPHIRLHGRGNARDIRTRDLSGDQLKFILKRGPELGLNLRDFSKAQPYTTNTGIRITGPHVHGEIAKRSMTTTTDFTAGLEGLIQPADQDAGAFTQGLGGLISTEGAAPEQSLTDLQQQIKQMAQPAIPSGPTSFDALFANQPALTADDLRRPPADHLLEMDRGIQEDAKRAAELSAQEPARPQQRPPATRRNIEQTRGQLSLTTKQLQQKTRELDKQRKEIEKEREGFADTSPRMKELESQRLRIEDLAGQQKNSFTEIPGYRESVEQYRRNVQALQAEVRAYDERVTAHNKQLEEYQAQQEEHKKATGAFNADINRYNANQKKRVAKKGGPAPDLTAQRVSSLQAQADAISTEINSLASRRQQGRAAGQPDTELDRTLFEKARERSQIQRAIEAQKKGTAPKPEELRRELAELRTQQSALQRYGATTDSPTEQAKFYAAATERHQKARLLERYLEIEEGGQVAHPGLLEAARRPMPEPDKRTAYQKGVAAHGANVAFSALQLPAAIANVGLGAKRWLGIATDKDVADIKQNEQDLAEMARRGGEGFDDNAVRIIGGTLAKLPLYAATAMAGALGGPAGEVAAFGVLGGLEASGQAEAPELKEVGKAAALSAAMIPIYKSAGLISSRPIRMAAAGAGGAGITALGGGNTEEILNSAIVTAILAFPGKPFDLNPEKPPKFAKNTMDDMARELVKQGMTPEEAASHISKSWAGAVERIKAEGLEPKELQARAKELVSEWAKRTEEAPPEVIPEAVAEGRSLGRASNIELRNAIRDAIDEVRGSVGGKTLGRDITPIESEVPGPRTLGRGPGAPAEGMRPGIRTLGRTTAPAIEEAVPGARTLGRAEPGIRGIEDQPPSAASLLGTRRGPEGEGQRTIQMIDENGNLVDRTIGEPSAAERPTVDRIARTLEDRPRGQSTAFDLLERIGQEGGRRGFVEKVSDTSREAVAAIKSKVQTLYQSVAERLGIKTPLPEAAFEKVATAIAVSAAKGGRSGITSKLSGPSGTEAVTRTQKGEGGFTAEAPAGAETTEAKQTTEEEVSRAKEIRGDEGQIQGRGVERPSSEGEGGADIQRAAEAGTEAGRPAQEITVDEAAKAAATSPENELPQPTEKQIAAGNYKKAPFKVGPLDISIENPRGSVRKGVNEEGVPWQRRMPTNYGYIKRTEGGDGEQVDIHVLPGVKGSYNGPIFVVNQNNADGSFDEHKAMLGWPNEQSARRGYLSNYDKGWNRIRSVVKFANPTEFKTWLDSADLKAPATSQKGGTNAQERLRQIGTEGKGADEAQQGRGVGKEGARDAGETREGQQQVLLGGKGAAKAAPPFARRGRYGIKPEHAKEVRRFKAATREAERMAGEIQGRPSVKERAARLKQSIRDRKRNQKLRDLGYDPRDLTPEQGTQILQDERDRFRIARMRADRMAEDAQKEFEEEAPDLTPKPPAGKINLLTAPQGKKPSPAVQKLREDLRKTKLEATEDKQTGLQNSNAWETAKPHVEENPEREVAVLDLNNLKKANDTYGHEIGDEYLKYAARAMRDEAEKAGVSERDVFRTGGDEFVIAGKKGTLKAVVEAVKKRVAEFQHEDFRGGIAAGVGPTTSKADAIQYADKKAMKKEQTKADQRAALRKQIEARKKPETKPAAESTSITVETPPTDIQVSERSPAEALADKIEAALDRLDEGDDEIQTIEDLVNHIEELAQDSEAAGAADVLSAVETYRQEQRDDLEMGKRGDMDAAQEAFGRALSIATSKLRGFSFGGFINTKAEEEQDEQEIAETPDEAEDGTRPRVTQSREPSGPRSEGETATVEIPGTDKTVPVRYEIRELADVFPSHNAQTFQPNPEYQWINDRRYDREKAYQQEVIDNSTAKTFKPKRLINNADTAEVGPPVIDENGNVLGGNSRTMMLTRFYDETKDGASYKAELLRQAASYGIDTKEFLSKNFKRPILVRVVTDDTLTNQRLITELNVTGTRALTPQERSIAESGGMSEAAINFLARQIDAAGEGATLAAILDARGVDIVNRLIDDGVFQPQERNALLKDGKILPEAKQRIERLLLARVFRDLDQMERTPATVKRNLERIAAPMATLSRIPDWDIGKEVQNALDLLQAARAARIPKLEEYVRQGALGEAQKFTEREIVLGNALQAGVIKTAKMFREYANDAVHATTGGLLFGAKSPDQSFADNFVPKTGKKGGRDVTSGGADLERDREGGVADISGPAAIPSEPGAADESIRDRGGLFGAPGEGPAGDQGVSAGGPVAGGEVGDNEIPSEAPEVSGGIPGGEQLEGGGAVSGGRTPTKRKTKAAGEGAAKGTTKTAPVEKTAKERRAERIAKARELILNPEGPFSAIRKAGKVGGVSIEDARESERALLAWDESRQFLSLNRAGGRTLNLVRGGEKTTRGTTFTSAQARIFAAKALEKASRATDDTVRGNLLELWNGLLEGAESNEEFAVGLPPVREHELFHVATLALTRHFGRDITDVDASALPKFRKVAKALRKKGYKTASPTVIAHEAAAHIWEDQIEDVGLGLSDAINFLYDYLRLVGRTYKADALKRFTHLDEEYRRIRDEIIEDLRKEATFFASTRRGAEGTREARRGDESVSGRRTGGITQGDLGEEKGPLEAIAFHGTPHRFEKFTTERIGTGEGVQSFGWGLYFAGNREVAAFYRDKLGPGKGVTTRDIAARLIQSLQGQGRTEQEIDRLATDELKRRRESSEDPVFRDQMNFAIQIIKDGEARAPLYKVELAPTEDEYLLWDKPLSEQSDTVKAALKEAGLPIVEEAEQRVDNWLKYGRELAPKSQGADAYHAIAFNFGEEKIFGKGELAWSANIPQEQRASEYLRSLGIRGIKYLDQLSRGAEQQSYNYVIFDEADIRIQALEALGGRYDSIPLPEGVKEIVSELFREHIQSGSEDLAGLLNEFEEGLGPAYPQVEPYLVDMYGIELDLAEEDAADDRELESKREEQRLANDLAVIPGDINNIRETLPFLREKQQDDVLKAEVRFAKPNGYGMLFTNGTGTGKTYSGLGIIARSVSQGKDSIIIAVPSDAIAQDWIKAGENLGLDIHKLENIGDHGGNGVVVTTYANFGQNNALAARDWDLVVSDESHYLSANQQGDLTNAGETLRALTLHPDGFHKASRMTFPALHSQIEVLTAARDYKEANKLMEQLRRLEAPLRAKFDNVQPEERPRTVMLSATPFAYQKSIRYANGFLFDWNEGFVERSGYNAPSAEEAFFIQHFGYRMRYGKLTQPDAHVNTEIMEIQFNNFLKQQEVLSGRALDVDADYDRQFILVHDAIGENIDEGMEFLRDTPKYRPLSEYLRENFKYHQRMYLLEALRARQVVPLIKKNIAMGRKVVVFHDFNKGGGFHPFVFPKNDAEFSYTIDRQTVHTTMRKLVTEFEAERPDLLALDFANLASPLQTMHREFPNAQFVNGLESERNRLKAKELFNADESGYDLLVVQSDAGREGISLHDTTGRHQRVLFNLGMPVRPTASTQIEGRIYRIGQITDAIFRYLTTGTNWERWTFAQKIAQRASTAENLALGEEARALKQAFIDAYLNPVDNYEPSEGEGTGGKAKDRARQGALTEFAKARTYYFGQRKRTARDKSIEGIDYFATPEPIGLKMVEWANVRPGEKILEPSGGHGAIARFFPETTDRTVIEPSHELMTRAALITSGAQMINDTFENHHIVNKYDAIVMNPPFGVGGKTAIEHLSKAADHLRDGGRIVVLLPEGPAADRRFDKWLYGNAEGIRTGTEGQRDIHKVADIRLPSVAFERAGTQVRSHVVILEKQTDKDRAIRIQETSRDYSDAQTINDLFDRIEFASLPDRIPVPAAPKATIQGPAEGAGVAVSKSMVTAEFRHTRTGVTMYVANFPTRVSSTEYARVNAAAKSFGGYYSRFKGGGAKPGFLFKSEQARQGFLDSLRPAEDEPFQALAGPEERRGLREVFSEAAEYGGLIGETAKGAWDRFENLFIRNLSHLERMSPESARFARRAAGSRGQATVLLQLAAAKIDQALQGSEVTWENVRAAMIESRLRGIRERYQDLSQMALDAYDEELVEAMNEGMFDILKYIEGRAGLDDTLAQHATALLEDEDIEGLRLFLAATFQVAADNVGSVPGLGPDTDEFEKLTSSAPFNRALRLYKDLMEAPIAESHRINEGIFSEALGPLDTYYPLIAVKEEGGVLHRIFGVTKVPYRKPKNIANYFATGLATHGYSAKMEDFAERINAAIRTNNKAALLSALDKEGLIYALGRNERAPGADGKYQMPNGEPAQLVDTGADLLIVRNGKTFHLQGARALIPTWLAKELKPILDAERLEPGMAQGLADKLIAFSLIGPMDLVFHSTNVLGTLVANTPFLGSGFVNKTVGNIPLTKWFNAIVQTLVLTDPTSEESIKDLTEMAKLGLIPPRFGSVTYNKRYAEMTGAKRSFTSAPLLYGPRGLDIRARLVMWRIAKLDKTMTPAERFKFVSQLGIYNRALESAVEKWAKQTRLAPFATAGMAMLRNGINAWTGMGPIPAGGGKGGGGGGGRAGRRGKRAAYRLAQMISGGAIGMLAMWLIAYKAYRDKWPWEEEEAKLLQIPLKQADRMSWLGIRLYGPDPTRTGYVNFSFFSPLVSRGSRALGLQGAFETKQLGGSTGQQFEAAQRDMMNSIAHPFTSGPLVRAPFVFTTGKEPTLTSLRDITGQFGPEFFPAMKKAAPGMPTLGKRSQEAVANLNPFFQMIAGGLGFGEEAERMKHAQSSRWVRMITDLAAPRLIGTSADVLAKKQRLAKELKASTSKPTPEAKLPDDVRMEMHRVDLIPSKSQRKEGETDAQYLERAENAGASIAERVRSIIETPAYKAMSKAEKQEALKRIVRDSRYDLTEAPQGQSDAEKSLLLERNKVEDRLRAILEAAPAYQALSEDDQKKAMRKLTDGFRMFAIPDKLSPEERQKRAERAQEILKGLEEKRIFDSALERLIQGLRKKAA